MAPSGVTKPTRGDEEASQSSDVLIRATVPAEEFALGDTLSRLPDAQFGSEAVAGAGDDLLPLLWARATDQDRLEAALGEDASTTSVTRLTDRGDERLYRITWDPMVELTAGLLTASDGTMIEASAENGRWHVRVLYPTQSALQDATSCWSQHSVSVDIESIRSMDGESTGEYGLTDIQYESLRTACNNGYFSVPRETELSALAEKMGVSHQALSERLRRGTRKLVQQSLFGNRCGGQGRL